MDIWKSLVSATEPLLEDLITDICKDLDKEDQIENMINKYLKKNKVSFMRKIKTPQKKQKNQIQKQRDVHGHMTVKPLHQ